MKIKDLLAKTDSLYVRACGGRQMAVIDRKWRCLIVDYPFCDDDLETDICPYSAEYYGYDLINDDAIIIWGQIYKKLPDEQHKKLLLEYHIK